MRNRIKSRELGAHHTVYDLTDSTMNDMNAYISRAIEEGADIHGHVIQALQQTNGRGSTDVKTGLTRAWESQEGNLLFSMAVRMDGLNNQEIAIATAVAVYESIKELHLFADDNLTMKLPNDIYIEGLKICGILATPQYCQGNWCNIGVGVNINYAPVVNDGRNVSTSLSRYGWTRDRKIEDFLSSFLDKFETHYNSQSKDKNYSLRFFDRMNQDGLIYVFDKNNPSYWSIGFFRGVETGSDGRDYYLVQDTDNIIHPYLCACSEVKNPDEALQYYESVLVVSKGLHHG